MRVFIDVGDSQAELGNNGVVLHIHDNAGAKVGRLRIGRATVEWMRGRSSVRTRSIRLEDLIEDVLDQAPLTRR
jgi:hypothetical protein